MPLNADHDIFTMGFFAGFCKGKKSRCVFVVVRFMGDLESAEEKGGFLSRENREWLNLDMW